MRSGQAAVAVAMVALVAGCGGAGADAPTDASIEDFCTAKSWLVAEGSNRFMEKGLPDDGELVELNHDWASELARVGTPENMSPDARDGFEKLVERVAGLEEDDVADRSFNWDEGAWEGDEEQAFARYVANTCP